MVVQGGLALGLANLCFGARPLEAEQVQFVVRQPGEVAAPSLAARSVGRIRRASTSLRALFLTLAAGLFLTLAVIPFLTPTPGTLLSTPAIPLRPPTALRLRLSAVACLLGSGSFDRQQTTDQIRDVCAVELS